MHSKGNNQQNKKSTYRMGENISDKEFISKIYKGDFPGGPVVKNPPYNAGDMGSIPGQETGIPHEVGQLSSRTSTREPVCRKLQSPRALEPARHNYRAHVPCSLCATTRRENPHATTSKKPTRCNKDPACCN